MNHDVERSSNAVLDETRFAGGSLPPMTGGSQRSFLRREESIEMRYLEHDSPSEEKNSGCVLANLLSQSLALYVELEKTHWHLRLNPAGDAVNFEAEGPTEIARQVCAISLRLIASISRLQRVLDPNFSPECAALFAAVEEKVAENCELASETLVFQGPSRVERTFRDARLSS
jgi:hypothetical protein